jgi:predicted enzyme related to lactoylglutathione lyase
LALAFASIVVDCKEPKALASFWAKVLGSEIEDDSDDEMAALLPRDGNGPYVLFLKVPDDKIVKNRLHFDLRPDDQAAEVERVLALGATRVDIGQGDVTWEVLADPEGNEFCILRALEPGEEGP